MSKQGAIRLKPQEVPFDHPQSTCMFDPSGSKPILTTPAALQMYGSSIINRCFGDLVWLAMKHQGIDYLQVFEDSSKAEPLWFIEDGEGGAITALLPSDY